MASLQKFASHYWHKPETANCTIVIPVPSQHSPHINSAPRITLRLHREYLSSKSLFLRDLFNGASLLDLIQTLCASQRKSPSAPLRIPRSRLPRLLPSPPSHPIVFLPVPDPCSIHALFHWMYFGSTHHIENALDQGDIKWEGLVRNVEYLGLSTDIKVFLGRWYRTWHLPCHSSSDPKPCLVDQDVDSDWDSDSEPYCSPPSDDDDDDEEIQSDQDCDRGRTRDIKPLIRLCRQLRLCTA